MSRKGSPGTRSILSDPKHDSQVVARFINMVMRSGKKSVAEKIVYGAMDVIGEKSPNALEVVEKALGAVLGAGLATLGDAGGVQRATHGVVAHAWQVLDATAADQHHAVLLQVMTFAANVRNDFVAIGQAHLGYFT